MATPPVNSLSNSLRTVHELWRTLKTDITVQGTTLAVTARAWDDVDQYFPPAATSTNTYLYYNVGKYVNTLELRFQTTADGDSQVLETWGARGEDHFTMLNQLTLTGGTQEADNSLFFVDTITNAVEGLPKSAGLIDSGNNRIARVAVELAGYSKLLFLATTLVASSTLRVQVTGY